VQLYSGKGSSLAIYKQQILNTWSIAGKLKLVSVQNRPLMVTWDVILFRLWPFIPVIYCNLSFAVNESSINKIYLFKYECLWRERERACFEGTCTMCSPYMLYITPYIK
jgi:hypothetical protein